MKLNYKRVIFVGFAFFLITAFWQAYDTIVPKILTDKFGLSHKISGGEQTVKTHITLICTVFFVIPDGSSRLSGNIGTSTDRSC